MREEAQQDQGRQAAAPVVLFHDTISERRCNTDGAARVDTTSFSTIVRFQATGQGVIGGSSASGAGIRKVDAKTRRRNGFVGVMPGLCASASRRSRLIEPRFKVCEKCSGTGCTRATGADLASALAIGLRATPWHEGRARCDPDPPAGYGGGLTCLYPGNP
jgi:hypothetical protein